MSFFPPEADARSGTKIEQFRVCVRVGAKAWQAVQEGVGDLQDDLRLWALIPRSVVHAAIRAARVPREEEEPRSLTPSRPVRWA